MGFKLGNKNILSRLKGNKKPSGFKFNDDPTKKPTVAEMLAARKAKMFEAQNQKNIEETGSQSSPPSEKMTVAQMLEARKQRLAAERGETPVESEVNPNVEEAPVVEDPAKVAYKENIKYYDPNNDDGWTYVDGDKHTANIRTRPKEWEETGVSDQSIWDANKNNVQGQYSNFEEYQQAAQDYRDSQIETQNRSDWVEHWSKKYWKPSWVRKYGEMGDWLKGHEHYSGDDMTKAFEESKNQQEFVAWAKENNPDFYATLGYGRGGRSGGSTSGKTAWSN